MPDESREIRELAAAVRDLTSRVARIEDALRNGPPGKQRSLGTPRADAPSTLESRIGSQWLNRIGIVAVLIGVSYFLKYAFENNFVGPLTRIWLGLAAGIGLMAWSEWFRRRYAVFSYSLKAVGLGTLYLSLWAAFQLYNLIDSSVALVGMTVVTLASIFLSLWQDAEILATFALVGGFATPLLISVHQEVPLFVYVALLDFATLAMIVYRPWRRLLLLALIGTAIVYFAWYARFFRNQPEPTFAFATLFFLIFAIAPVAQRRLHAEFPWGSPLPFLVALANAVIYFLEFDSALQSDNDRAIVAFAAAAIYLILAPLVRSDTPGLSSLKRLHSGLAVALVALGIAFRFEALWITIGWFIEFLVVLTIGFLQESEFLRWAALALIAATAIKVFAYDVWRLERGYRIVVFIGLGVLCLAVSFLYQNDLIRIADGHKRERV